MEYLKVVEILGGEKVLRKKIQNRMNLIELCHDGLPAEVLVHLAKYLSMTKHQVAELLPVPGMTIESYAHSKQFDQFVSEQIVQIAQTAARGTEVFGDKEKFLAWLYRPNKALANKTPFSLLSSRFGIEMVLEELGRIEHGLID